MQPITLIVLMCCSSLMPLSLIKGDVIEKPKLKRGVPWFGDGFTDSLSFGGNKFAPLDAWTFPPRNYNGQSPYDVANVIAAAKQASANVQIAQQQVQAAKDNVLNQQRAAMEKEAAASLLTQKSEAAAAIQRSEAASAAQAVVLAQQRFAAAKAAAAHQQKIAAVKEAEAAAAVQRSAHAAAAEIQRSEHELSKYGDLYRNGAAATSHHLVGAKDAAFAPITIGTNHVPDFSAYNPWQAIAPWSSSNGNAAPTHQPWA